MKNIGHIIVCDEVFNSPNGEFIIKQPINTIYTPIVPTHYSFVISIGLINLKADVSYTAVIKLISPSGKKLFENGLDFDIGKDEKNTSENFSAAAGYNVNCRNILLEEFGDYVVSVEIEGDHNQLILPVAIKEN